MFRRILDSYRRYRLPLLLLALACSAIFYGNSCDECECSSNPFEIVYGDQGIIWVEENIASTHPLKLVVNKEAVTVSNVTWSVLSAPSPGLIKPGGYEIVPATGQDVSIKLDPLQSFNAGALTTMFYNNALVAYMQVRVDFQSSAEPPVDYRVKNVLMYGMQPSLHAISVTGDAALYQGNPVSGKRSNVDCILDGPVNSAAAVLTVKVLYGDQGIPYQFSAKVGPSNRQYLTIGKIESVDPLTAKFYLNFTRGATPPGNPSIYSFPILVKADGTNGRHAMCLIDGSISL